MAASSSCAPTPSHPLTDRERVIGELTRGRDFADTLRLMLREAGVDGCASAQDLVGRILDSFTQSISVLCAAGESDEVSQIPAVVNSPCRKSEDSGDSCKTPASKDRRGCYKRKKTSETWTKETSASFNDGHAWRKYGQKTILNARFPRNYFRCTHKYEQGCQASKHVQQIEDDPPRHRSTYHGHHTCNKVPDQTIVDSPTPDSSIIWSFQSRQNDVLFEDKDAVKRERGEDYRVGDYYISPELGVFDTDHLGGFSSGSDVISSDVYSCTASTHSMDVDVDVDVDMLVGSVNFDDFPEFGNLT